MGKIRKTKTTIRQGSFDIIFVLFLTLTILKISFFSRYIPIGLNVIYAVCYILLFVREVLFRKLSLRDLILTILVFVIFIIITASNNQRGTNPLICAFAFALCARGVELDKSMDVAMRTSFFWTCVIIISSQLGIVQDYTETIIDGRFRHYLGFLYSLYPAAILFGCILICCYLKKKRVWSCALLLVDIYVYIMTRSRISFFLSIIVLILCNRNFIRKVLSFKIVKWLVTCCFPISAIICLLFTVFYSSNRQWMKNLDKLLMYRLSLSKAALIRYPISLFGSSVDFSGATVSSTGQKYTYSHSYLTVDSAYLDALVKYGILTAVAIIAFFTVLMVRSYKKNNYSMVFILLMISLHCCIDFSMFNLTYNAFLLALFNTELREPVVRKRRIIKFKHKKSYQLSHISGNI